MKGNGAGVLNALQAQATLLWRSGRVGMLWIVTVGMLLLLELLSQIGMVFMPGVPMPPTWPRLFGSFDLLGIVMFGWGIAIWSGEPPEDRDAHWSVPLSIVLQDMSRVVAGWLFSLSAVGLLCGAGLLLAWKGGGWPHIAAANVGVWVGFVMQATIPFGVGAGVGLLSSKPVRVIGIGALTFMALVLLQRRTPMAAVLPTWLVSGPIGAFGVAKSALRESFDPAFHSSAPWSVVAGAWIVALVIALPSASRAGHAFAEGLSVRLALTRLKWRS